MRASKAIGIVLLLALAQPGLAPTSAQSQPTLDQLYQDLQSEDKTDQAMAQLLRAAKTNEKVAGFLATHLPMLLEQGPSPATSEIQRGIWVRPVWRNAALLAGHLRIRAAVPALVRWLTVSTSPVVGLGTGEEALVDSPAGTALVNIGDPSIPSGSPLLSRPDSNERYRAALCLACNRLAQSEGCASRLRAARFRPRLGGLHKQSPGSIRSKQIESLS